jgi:hypothetical protein
MLPVNNRERWQRPVNAPPPRRSADSLRHFSNQHQQLSHMHCIGSRSKGLQGLQFKHLVSNPFHSTSIQHTVGGGAVATSSQRSTLGVKPPYHSTLTKQVVSGGPFKLLDRAQRGNGSWALSKESESSRLIPLRLILFLEPLNRNPKSTW